MAGQSGSLSAGAISVVVVVAQVDELARQMIG